MYYEALENIMKTSDISKTAQRIDYLTGRIHF